jgi:hypothetical protein
LRFAGSRGRSVLLLLSLFVLAILIASSSSSLGTSLFRENLTAHVTTKTVQAVQASGTLLVKVLLLGNGTSNGTPISGVNVSVTDQDNPKSSGAPLSTNESGELQITLTPAQYSVSVSNLEFRGSALAAVYAKHTTDVDAFVNRTSYPVLSASLSDQESSGYQDLWAQLRVSLNTSMAASTVFAPDGRVFVDPTYRPSLTDYSSNTGIIVGYSGVETSAQVPATIVASDLVGSGRGAVQWLTLMPDGLLQITGLFSVTLATYNARLQVIANAT